MYAFVRSLTPHDVEAIAAQLFVELLKRGFTSVAEFHYLRNAKDGTPYEDPVEMARRILLALACIGAAEAGSALAEGTTPLTAANFDDFVEEALAAGKTAMVRFIASEG